MTGTDMAVRLRDLAWTDIEVLTAAEAVIFPDDAWSAESWWAELAERPRRDYVVAVADGDEILGYAGLDHAGDVADVMTIATLPPARGRGVGHLLLQEILGRADDRRAEAVLLEVRADNAAAIALYEHAGFAVISVRRRYYQPEGVDALVMRRLLTGAAPTPSEGGPHG
jgi:ribosomal-protein-alanine N-acetyltransferase